MVGLTLGSVAVYSRDASWRRAVGRRLAADGHSHDEMESPHEIAGLLLDRAPDVLALSVRDEADSQKIHEALGGARLPPHTIVFGNASALALTLHRRRGGTFRYVPGKLSPVEVARLIDLTLSAGGWDEAPLENGSTPVIEEIDLKDLLDEAAATVYAPAKRKSLRFTTVFEGTDTWALTDPVRLARAFETLMRLAVSLAPRHGSVSVEAEAGAEDWILRFRVADGHRSGSEPAQLAVALREQSRTLTALSNALKQLGGMLWVELGGPHALAFSISLPHTTAGAADRVPA